MCWAPFSALCSISTSRAPASLGHDCDSSDFADGEPGGLGWSWGSPVGMHWGTARPRLLSTALVHSRHSEGAAPEAEGMRVALRPSVAVGRATIPPPVPAVGWGGCGDTQVAPDSATAGRGLRGNSRGGLSAHEVPAGNGLSRGCGARHG